jgi:hypothetical protein
MSSVVNGLVEGEETYIHDFAGLLDDVKTRAESATSVPWDDKLGLEKAGEDIVGIIRQKREILQKKIGELRETGNKVIQESEIEYLGSALVEVMSWDVLKSLA